MVRQVKGRTIGGAVVAMAMVGVGLVAAPDAEAALTECAGSKLREKALTNSKGQAKGRMEMWYSRADGGTNCVMVFPEESGYHTMQTGIQLEHWNAPSYIETQYKTGHSRPLNATQADNHCVWYYGEIKYGSTWYTASWGFGDC